MATRFADAREAYCVRQSVLTLPTRHSTIAAAVPVARPRRRKISLLMHSLLGLAALIGVVIGTSVGIPAWLGLKSMIVVSGSMEPLVMVGDVVLIKPLPADSVQVGELVTFRTLSGPGMTTHRVIAEKEIEGRRYFQTKGDANDSPDANLVPFEAVYGKVAFVEPKVGYLLLFATTLWGKLALIILPVLLVVVSEILDLRKLIRPRPAEQVPPAATSAGGVGPGHKAPVLP